ncbi:hypothetical protein EOD39_18791 [Acipenser ruthenus]|uniref:Uncharacterized protein n=1 Tax=Acipenser ruthenus TaxID=7906 RepID=A0A444V018_ACIRT|nr:hypothetical protein EOD39_18791 [Acipenser ruthenus]
MLPEPWEMESSSQHTELNGFLNRDCIVQLYPISFTTSLCLRRLLSRV